jgi:GNAT superfamily N-acetyltransferase
VVDDDPEGEPALDSLHDDLVRAGALVPVALGGPEERAWLDCDLASMAENRLGDRTDPRDLDRAHRTDWRSRATTERAMALAGRSEYERCYWLSERGERVGTLAIARSAIGSTHARLSSFYVLPPYRGQGTGRRALERTMAAAARHDLGIRLETSWTWQRAVRFYLAAGMWIYMWKRDLSFLWDAGTPRHRIEVGDREASLSVAAGEGEITLARARRRGDALELDPMDRSLERDKRLGDAWWHAESTLALALAMHGWPLVRSREQWDECYYADAGAPEALAYKIAIWEAWDRNHGWAVDTPRIPGLEYPTWDEFEARWKAESKELLGG